MSMSGIKMLETLAGYEYESIKSEYIKIFLKSGLTTSLSSYNEKPDNEPNVFDFENVINKSWKNELTDNAK